jgi:hydroxymethylbilane synthase
MEKLIIATRSSPLALWQANEVATKLQSAGIPTELKSIETIGDKKLDVTLSKIGDKGVFTLELEEMLLKGYRICAKYHADLSYYLGVIYYYQKKNTESLKFFKEFQNFESKEVARYSKDHDKRLVDVNDIVVELEEEAALFNNPVPFNPKVVQNVSSSFD